MKVLMFCISMVVMSYIALTVYDTPPKVKKGSVEVFLEPIKPEIKTVDNKDTYLVNTKNSIRLTPKEFECMAKNIYFESKFEPYIGKIAIANVTYNRLMEGKWGNNVCKVVYKKKQFSWTIKQSYEKPRGKQWLASIDAVRAFSRGVRVVSLKHSNHYHADYIVKPEWAYNMHPVAKIGPHIFYAVK